ncbi:UDP-2,4-diacetamido-2,4,6-trideoxy-beta-L-altropyranose hydrolase [Pseudomonas sp. Gutcm_11s]|uniref:UDP-2,4-diacetamido-2,4, 6-trideoxy-beta-L-altropyranose hydrolase n=1 Tax=Pseudomonas sp. Gutcm_11s TaxID=3026088 RepID=UPI002360345F|nr:UDP-2,4-diacetamido-2,4,6-trideoxy-beta-L-altropyranose hydrolase [Pseudomonas sp. Gutcm_11s]MDD0842207.1 UDP-2,4-diacetamido-2,4,6-trideoxy-beta-L-altropyranose hydrolase [Pseudomonas sp. Gutcm_11s]
MKVVAFRADASLQIGSGHVMRCLTLADALRRSGAECHFICRAHPGHLLTLISERGYSVHPLAVSAQAPVDGVLTHARWLGVTQEQDARDCASLLQQLCPDWLVVDHYALDAQWEGVQRVHCGKLLVIDDLADRSHLSDLLLDQNLGRTTQAYRGLVPDDSVVLAGPQYALLRPEFAQLRDYSLRRRGQLSSVRQILVSMGGVDLPNATTQVLRTLRDCGLANDCRVTVIMGATAPWTEQVKELLQELPFAGEVMVNVRDMSQLMANSDLAIGAAGGSSWERCCMGLPTLLVTLADNQLRGAQALHDAKAARWLGSAVDISQRLASALAEVSAALGAFNLAAAAVCDGEGAGRVASYMLESA